MSTQKLYTEEQVIEVFEKYGNMSAINARNILDLSESIQIPSDEEIEKMAIERFPIYMEVFGSEKIDGNKYFRSIFIEGIECLRDKIQGGNK